MKNYEEKEEHVAKRDVLVGITCDFCGGAKRDGAHFVRDGKWPKKCLVDPDARKYNNRDEEVETLELRLSDVYPEGGFVRTWTLDICPRCFMEKIVPLAMDGRREGRVFNV